MEKGYLRFLHVGCGLSRKENTTPYFASDDWQEVRLDISPDANPDIVDSIVGLSTVADNSYDAVFSSHNIEHVFAHEVGITLGSFYRVLKETGHLVILCPDLQLVAEHIARGNLLEPLYVSPAGPIAPVDILFGHRGSLSSGQYGMQHRMGFTQQALVNELRHAGFQSVCHWRTPDRFELGAIASRAAMPDEELIEMAIRHFPQLEESLE